MENALHCIDDCGGPSSLVLWVVFLSIGVVGLLGARWRPMTLAVSMPLILTVALFGFPSSLLPDSSLLALVLPLVGALLNRRAVRSRGSSLTSA